MSDCPEDGRAQGETHCEQLKLSNALCVLRRFVLCCNTDFCSGIAFFEFTDCLCAMRRYVRAANAYRRTVWLFALQQVQTGLRCPISLVFQLYVYRALLFTEGLTVSHWTQCARVSPQHTKLCFLWIIFIYSICDCRSPRLITWRHNAIEYCATSLESF